MPWKLRYGDGATLELELPYTEVIGDFARPPGEPLEDTAAAVAAALEDPLDFPPLSRAIVPGDKVAVALDGRVPQAAKVVAGVVQSLRSGEHPPQRVQLVISSDGSRSLQAALDSLPESIRDGLDVEWHNPLDTAALCYLAASSDGKPIYLNRTLCEADVVLPVSVVRLEGALGYWGVHDGLFPAFSDEATQKRFRAPSSQGDTVHQRRRREEADEAAWLLGIQFTMQITPGPGDSILHLVAGEAQAVAAASRSRCEAAWHHRSPDRAALVVATIEGGPAQQTWDSFARALYSAAHAVSDGGAILLCTELACQPGPALQRLTAAGDDERTLRELRRDRSPDAISAALLALAKQRARIYLMSRLDDQFVEDLGVGPVQSAAEIERLSRQFASCILLGNAQHLMLEFEGDPDLSPAQQRVSVNW